MRSMPPFSRGSGGSVSSKRQGASPWAYSRMEKLGSVAQTLAEPRWGAIVEEGPGRVDVDHALRDSVGFQTLVHPGQRSGDRALGSLEAQARYPVAEDPLDGSRVASQQSFLQSLARVLSRPAAVDEKIRVVCVKRRTQRRRAETCQPAVAVDVQRDVQQGQSTRTQGAAIHHSLEGARPAAEHVGRQRSRGPGL